MTSIQDETGEILLGGKAYKIEALTLDQLQLVLPGLERMTKAPDVGVRIAEARAVIAAAVGTTSEELGALKVTLPELLQAVTSVCQVAGLEQWGKQMPAERAE